MRFSFKKKKKKKKNFKENQTRDEMGKAHNDLFLRPFCWWRMRIFGALPRGAGPVLGRRRIQRQPRLIAGRHGFRWHHPRGWLEASVVREPDIFLEPVLEPTFRRFFQYIHLSWWVAFRRISLLARTDSALKI